MPLRGTAFKIFSLMGWYAFTLLMGIDRRNVPASALLKSEILSGR
jgi:hypothetical protein